VHLHVRQLLCARLLALAVERDDGQARARVLLVLHLRARIGIAAEAMLGREHLHHIHLQRQQRINEVRRADAPAVIGDHRHPAAREQREVLRNAFGSHRDLRRSHRDGARDLGER